MNCLKSVGVVLVVVILSLILATPAIAGKPQRYTFEVLEPPGSEGSEAFGVNDAGHVVGTAFEPGGFDAAFLFDGASYTRFLIFPPNITGTTALGINDAGQIVGGAQSNIVGAQSNIVGAQSTAYLKDGETVEILALPPGAVELRAHGINNFGQIAGFLVTPGSSSPFHGFLRDSDGAYTQIDVPGAADTFASGINDSGQVVGSFRDMSSVVQADGFVYDGGTFTIFDVPDAVTEPHGIDACGRVVGTFVGADGRARGFMKDGKKFETIEVPGAVMTWVNGISQTTGLIVGRFINELPGTTEQSRGFLATPVHKNLECRTR